MFEFSSVPIKRYTDPVSGESVQMRAIHRTVSGTGRTVKVAGRDIDQLVRAEMTTYENMLKFAEANSRKLSEKLFDLGKIDEVVIPG